MSENIMPQSDAGQASAESSAGISGRLSRLETDMEWVKRLLWFLIALDIGIYLDLPALVQGILP